MRFDGRELPANATAPNNSNHDLKEIMHEWGVLSGPRPRRDGKHSCELVSLSAL
jgi:hypothetical protein